MRHDPDEQVRRFLEEELDDAESREALHAIADDDASRRLLRFEYHLRGAFYQGADQRIVPEAFADRVMRSVTAEPSTAPALRPSDLLARVWGWLSAPRPVSWRPAYALAAAVVLAVGVVVGPRGPAAVPEGSAAQPPVQRAALAESDSPEVLIRFVFVDSSASSVSVAGDFTAWEPLDLRPQEVDGRVVWSGLVPVPRGEHRYMFVVNDREWVSDPLATMHRDDGFGNRNAVLIL